MKKKFELETVQIIGMIIVIIGVAFLLWSGVYAQSFFPGVEQLAKNTNEQNSARTYIGIVISGIGMLLIFGKSVVKIVLNYFNVKKQK